MRRLSETNLEDFRQETQHHRGSTARNIACSLYGGMRNHRAASRCHSHPNHHPDTNTHSSADINAAAHKHTVSNPCAHRYDRRLA